MNTQEFRVAILHKLISELEDVNKTQLQKLGYFLQEALGVPTKYLFRMHHYGPFAEAMETDTARLRITGYIDIQPDPRGYGFHMTPIDSPLADWTQMVEPYDESVNRVMTTLGDWPTHDLELAATIHFVKKLLPDESKDEVLNKVEALKPKFSQKYIESLQGRMERLGLL